MAYFVHIIEECWRDGRRQGIELGVRRFGDTLEKAQSLAALDRFPAPYVKKSLGKHRLLIEEHRLDGHVVLCFVRLIVRGDAEYKRFLENPASLRTSYKLTGADVAAILTQRLANDVPPSLELTDIETAYLFQEGATPHDEIVLESFEWVDWLARTAQQPFLATYHEIVEDICTTDRNDNGLRHHPRQSGRAVLYRKFAEPPTIFLIAPIESPQDEARMRREYAEVLRPDARTPRDELLRRSRRSYPALIALDSSMWIAVQQSAEANLALSPEEAVIVQRVHGPHTDGDPAGAAYPLFINGRPGSGKSTVLQYLFADHLFQHLARPAEQRTARPPLYLTYSAQLLQHARRIVGSILQSDAIRQLATQRIDRRELAETLDACFASYRDFLLSRIPATERGRFRADAYVDFPRFRQHWTKHFQADPQARVRRLGPELSWHVIRTYIKGMRDGATVLESGDDGANGGGYFDPDCYAEYPARRKTVTQQTFELVHDQVWKGWYELASAKYGWWDDQELTRAVLDLPDVATRYPAIFCDEAQDFTRIELELILSLSIYPWRNVPRHLLHRVPFAFAGDPFQTLNPTGFDWGAVQAEFHDRIVANLDRTGTGAVRFNFRELAYNYRSAEPIVKVCNAIQLLRGIAFELKEITPQRTWFPAEAAEPCYFDCQDHVVEERLREHEEAVIIVPCHEGGEADFVREDPLLARIALREDGEVSRNVFSPMRAKGLEFSRVVLYKFGEASKAVEGLRDVIAGWQPMRRAREQTLEAEYFLNRLYVGASRARTRLVVVDSADGLERFWRFVCDHSASLAMLSAYRTLCAQRSDANWTEEHLGRLVCGNPEDWTDGRDKPEELAAQFLGQGESQRDAYFVDRARSIYERLGELGRAEYCTALGHEFAGEFDQAGQLYARQGRIGRALECFWKARAYARITGLTATPETAAAPARCAATFMESPRAASDCASFGADLTRLLGSAATRAEMRLEPTWDDVIAAYINALGVAAEAGPKPFAEPEWRTAFDHIGVLRELGFDVSDTARLARLAFHARQLAQAIAIWNRVGGRKEEHPSWLLEAQAETEPFPVRLEYLAALRRWEDCVVEHERHRHARLSPEHGTIVIDALTALGRLAEAGGMLRRYPDRIRLRRLYDAALTAGEVDVARTTAAELLGHLERTGEWQEFVTFALPSDRGAPRESLKYLTTEAVKILASSEELPSEPSRDKKKLVSTFLRKVLFDVAPRDTGVSLYVAAAAFERAGLHSDSLEHYESVLEGKWGDRPARFARERWMLNKQRQLGVADSREKAERIGKALDAKAREWGYGSEALQTILGQLSPFPPVEPASEPPVAAPRGPFAQPALEPTLRTGPQHATPGAAATDPAPHPSAPTVQPRVEAIISTTGFVLRVDVVATRRRLNIIHADSGEVVTVLAAERRMTSNDFALAPMVEVPDGVASGFVPEWDMNCRVYRVEPGGLTIVELALHDVVALRLAM